MSGFVSLVGAGPGDPGLLTLAGRDRLSRAEVVVYDRLISPALLDYAPPEAERIFAGKSPQAKALSQDEINALLVERGLAGQRVVRLKGGDPFVFGRGGEEALALVAAGVRVRGCARRDVGRRGAGLCGRAGHPPRPRVVVRRGHGA